MGEEFGSYSYRNRIYVEPESRHAIYISLGPMIKGYQKYPPFEPWMIPYVSQDTYNQWVQWLQEKLEECPMTDSCLCCKTVFYGCCCCCCTYTPASLIHFNQEVCDGFNQIVSESGIPAVLEVEEFQGCCKQRGQSDTPWVDSKGRIYVWYGKHGPRPQGKPPGYKIVINLAESITWPPPAQTIIIYQPGVQPPPPQPYTQQPASTPLGHTQAPPPYSELQGGTQKRFCISCGAELVEGGKFCHSCGASVGF